MDRNNMNHDDHSHENFEDIELNNWRKKLIGVWIFSVPIAFLMLFSRLFKLTFISESLMTLIILFLAFPVIFIFGFSTIKSGLRGFYTFYFNMDSLIALGTLIAYATGIFAFFGILDDYSGVAAAIMSIFITGKYIESRAKGRATKEIKKLLELGAKK